MAYLEKGDAAEALPMLERSVNELARFRFPQIQGLFTAALAEARLSMGDPVAAREAADRAVALMRDGSYPYGLGWTRRALAHIARAAGDLETGLAESADALAIFTSIHARFEAARTRLELAELTLARGDLVGATTWLTEAAQALALMAVSRYDAHRRLARRSAFRVTRVIEVERTGRGM